MSTVLRLLSIIPVRLRIHQVVEREVVVAVLRLLLALDRRPPAVCRWHSSARCAAAASSVRARLALEDRGPRRMGFAPRSRDVRTGPFTHLVPVPVTTVRRAAVTTSITYHAGRGRRAASAAERLSQTSCDSMRGASANVRSARAVRASRGARCTGPMGVRVVTWALAGTRSKGFATTVLMLTPTRVPSRATIA